MFECRQRCFLSVVLVVFAIVVCPSELARSWTYGGNEMADDCARYMEWTSGGRLVVTGYIDRGDGQNGKDSYSDLFVFLVDPSTGDVLADYVYGEEGVNDVGMCVRETSRGDIIVAGVINDTTGFSRDMGDPGHDPFGDIFVMMLDENLEPCWNGPFIFSLGDNYKCGAGYVIETDDGGFVICGGQHWCPPGDMGAAAEGTQMYHPGGSAAGAMTQSTGASYIYGFMMKISEAHAPGVFPPGFQVGEPGSLTMQEHVRRGSRDLVFPVMQWHHVYDPGSNYDGPRYLTCLQQCENAMGQEELVAVGVYDPEPPELDGIYLVKVPLQSPDAENAYIGILRDPDGDGDEYYEARSISQQTDGGFVVTGAVATSEPSQKNVFLWKFETDWDLATEDPHTVWYKEYDWETIGAHDFGFAVQAYQDFWGTDLYALTGYTTSEENASRDALMMVVDVYGYCYWSKNLGGPEAETGFAVIVDGDEEEYYVAGYQVVEEADTTYYRDIYVQKTGSGSRPCDCRLVGTDVYQAIRVPDDYPTIQQAIDAAVYGDIVEVADGTYMGVGNRNLNFQGKTIYVRSANGPDNCKIDCEGAARGFLFGNGEGPHAIVEGFTIVNGYASNGGGIYCYLNASPTVMNCIIKGNHATHSGGGVCARSGSSPTFVQCVIAGNYAESYGGGVFAESSQYFYGCTISGNRAALEGGGFHSTEAGTNLILGNTILWGNGTDAGEGDELYCDGSGVNYCCCDLRYAGVGGDGCSFTICDDDHPNIDADPLFCDPIPWDLAPSVDGNYHLQPSSPCTSDQQPDCGLIGALDIGC